MTKVIKIGTQVTIHNKIDGTVNRIQLSGKEVMYNIGYVNEDSEYIEIWVYEHEITSDHKQHSIINESLR